MSISRPSVRLRRVTASVGAFTLAGVLALSGAVGGGVAMTDAAWNDAEVAQASVKAQWMEGFTQVTNPGWRLRNQYRGPNYGVSGPVEFRRDFGLAYPAPSTTTPGTATATGSDDRRSSLNVNGFTTDATTVPPRETSDLLWMGRYSTSLANYQIASARHCLSFPSPTLINASTTSCPPAAAPSPSRLSAYQLTDGFTFHIQSSTLHSKQARVNISQVSSAAYCYADGSTEAQINHPAIVAELANATGTVVPANGYFNAEQSIVSLISSVVDDPEERFDGTSDQWARFNVNGASDSSFVLTANIRKNIYKGRYHALAEMDLIVQVYSSGETSTANGVFIDQINIPLTRSECAFADGSNNSEPLPTRAGAFRGEPEQLGWPRRSLGNVVPNSSQRLTQFTFDGGEGPNSSGMAISQTPPIAARINGEIAVSPMVPADTDTSTSLATGAPSTAGTTSTTPRTTTVTTTVPTVSAAPASITTPPATKTLTSTSAAPAVVIPDEPRPLSLSARLEDVGTATVGGDDLVVVTPGTTVPTDAQQGLAALEIWLSGGDPGDTWATFTSDDAEQDGWRWAAVNQTTGTVVYIR